MKSKQLPRRIIQYIIGIVLMAVSNAMLKRTEWGLPPISSVPDAVANITPLSLGTATILLHLLCVILQIVVQRKVSVKSLLTMCVGVPFGYLIDAFLLLWNPTLVLWQKIIVTVAGIAIQGLGVAMIIGCDLMLPSPDELNNVISKVFGKKLSAVKITADAVYVIIAVVINLISTHSLASVGIGTIASVPLTGWFVGLSIKVFPMINMPPFFNMTKAE